MTWLDLLATREATVQQVVASGAGLGYGYRDPIDGDRGYRPAGLVGREVPEWTLEKARTYSVAAYRTNPMARAIIDTYTSFCVGDRGVSWQASNPQVAEVVEGFWNDPRNNLGGEGHMELALRSTMLNGERLLELLTGPISGVVRLAPTDPSWITDVQLVAGNPLWPDRVWYRWGGSPAEERALQVVAVDDASMLRAGECLFLAPFKALESDRRSMPFLFPVLDWLDSYDQVLSNLIDRTALARHIVFDVEVEGGQDEVDAFIDARGGTHPPRSGSLEVHSNTVKWNAMRAETGAYEDSAAARSVLTLTAAGSGLSKHWLAEPEDTNRATALTMAEPVRRRVKGVQRMWLEHVTEQCRYAVDRAVAASRLQPRVTAADARTGEERQVPAAMTVTVLGPEIAAADAEITAKTMLNLATGLEKLVKARVMTPEAAAAAAKKAWEDYMGVPYIPELGTPDADPDAIAAEVDRAQQPGRRPRLVAND